MMKKIVVFLAFVAIGMLLAATVQAETIRGEGRYISNTLTHLTPFTKVDVRGEAQVDIWQRDHQEVSVSGKTNLVALADIRVENDTLVIDFKRPVHIKGSHALHVSVGVPGLEAVAVRGNGRVRIRGTFETPQLALSAADKSYLTGDGLKANLLRVQVNQHAEVDVERMQVKQLEAAAFNKAEVELSGFAEAAQLINNSSEDMDADGLRVLEGHVQVNGAGDVEVFAVNNLKAEALGRGEILYHGSPVLMRSGNLKLIQPAFKD